MAGGRTVWADRLLVAGCGDDADYAAIPRAVYVDPAVSCVGLTAEQAADGGIPVRTACFDQAEVERATLVRGDLPGCGRVGP